jgi:copper(I)-binding protein
LLAGEAPGGVPVSVSIRNDGDRDERLLGGSTPVAQCVGVRHAIFADGQRETAPALEGIVIPAGAMIALDPGKSHLALFGLETDLVQGETFPLTLRFELVGEVTVIARVRRRADAAGVAPLPEVSLGDLTIALASAPPAPGGSLSGLDDTPLTAVGRNYIVIVGATGHALVAGTRVTSG